MIWQIPRTDGTVLSVPQDIGDQLYIIGANGSGKSALIQHLVSQGGARVRRVSAHRQTWLPSGTINFTPTNRKNWDKNFRGYEIRPDARWMDHDPVSKQSAILFDLVAADNERARSIQRRVDDGNLARISHTVTAEGFGGSVGAEFLPREQVEQRASGSAAVF